MPITLGIALAVTAGYVDALAYLSDGAFVANMTGNTVLLGIAATWQAWQQVLRAAGSLAMFLLGATLARLILRAGAHPSRALGLAAAVLLLAALLPSDLRLPRLFVLAHAMGIQDAAVTRFDGSSINTVFVTGDLVNLGKALVRRPAAQRKAWQIASVWLGYLAGAAGGAVVARLTPPPLWLNPSYLAAAILVGALAAWSGWRARERERSAA